MAFLFKLSVGSILFLAVIALATCKYCDLAFQDCGSTSGKIYKVQINETCDKDKQGVLVKGTNVKINFTFSSNVAQSELTSKVFGQLPGLKLFIPFPLANPNACKDSGLSCPLKANTKYQFLPLLEIKSSYPSIKAVVKWELQDKSGNNVFCVLIGATIKDNH